MLDSDQLSPEELLRDPHLASVVFFPEIDHPSEGKMHTMRTPTSYSATPCAAPAPAPTLGQHTHEVLQSAGFSDEDVKKIAGAG